MLAQAAPAAAAVGAASPASALAAWQGPRAPGFGQNPTPGAPADLASLGGQLAALAALHPGLLRALAYAPPPPLQQLVQPGAPAGNAGGAAVAAPVSHPAVGALGQAGHMRQQGAPDGAGVALQTAGQAAGGARVAGQGDPGGPGPLRAQPPGPAPERSGT